MCLGSAASLANSSLEALTSEHVFRNMSIAQVSEKRNSAQRPWLGISKCFVISVNLCKNLSTASQTRGSWVNLWVKQLQEARASPHSVSFMTLIQARQTKLGKTVSAVS